MSKQETFITGIDDAYLAGVHRLEDKQKSKNLVACKECGHMVAKKAKVCPQCGNKFYHWTIGKVLVGGFVIITAFSMIKTLNFPTENTQLQKSQITDNFVACENRGSKFKYDFVSNSCIKKEHVRKGMGKDVLIWSLGNPSKTEINDKGEELLFYKNYDLIVILQGGKVINNDVKLSLYEYAQQAIKPFKECESKGNFQYDVKTKKCIEKGTFIIGMYKKTLIWSLGPPSKVITKGEQDEYIYNDNYNITVYLTNSLVTSYKN